MVKHLASHDYFEEHIESKQSSETSETALVKKKSRHLFCKNHELRITLVDNLDWHSCEKWKGFLKDSKFDELLKIILDAFMTEEDDFEEKIKNRNTKEGPKKLNIQYVDRNEDGKR